MDNKGVKMNTIKQNGSDSKATAQYGIYMSCVKDDQEIALKLYNDLKNLGLKPWLDSEDALPGKDEKNQIHQVI